MKPLSKKQSEVIRLMREGKILKCTGFTLKRVQSNTIQSLKKLGLISNSVDSIFEYQLTELGNNLDIPISADHSHVV